MPGIKANSASVTMLDGDTLPDQNVVGYATAERITLSVAPAPTTSIDWTLSAPTGSDFALLEESGFEAAFTPEVQGIYVVVAVVDGTTTYILRIEVSVIGAVTIRQSIGLPAIDPANIATPASGRVLFSDATNLGHLSVKLPDNSVVDIEI